MIQLLKNILPRLINHSQKLEKIELFVDRSWILVDKNHNNHEYIFERDGKLVMSFNGSVTIGSWRLLATNKLLINRVSDILMLNNLFFNKDILILQNNGTQDEPFVLVDEQKIQNYNYISYLNELRAKLIDEEDKKNKNKRITKNNKVVGENLDIGDVLKNDKEILSSGIFQHITSINKYFEIENNIIKSIFYKQLYKFYKDGNWHNVHFYVKIFDNISIGDQLFVEDNVEVPIYENFTISSQDNTCYKIKVDENFIVYKSFPEILNLVIFGIGFLIIVLTMVLFNK